MSRTFSKQLYQQNNNRAVAAAANYFTVHGWKVTKYPDGQYGIDLAIEKNGNYLLIEPEVKRDWEEGPFPFNDIRIPFRKEKYKTDNTYFMIFSDNLADFFLIHSSKLGPVEAVKTAKNSASDIQNEKFYVNDILSGTFFHFNGLGSEGSFPFTLVPGSFCFLDEQEKPYDSSAVFELGL